MRITCGGCLLIPRDMQFSSRLFLEIITPENHAAPYIDPTTRREAPFMSGPFCGPDPLFPSVARDWHLYTVQEVVCLKSIGALALTVAPGFSVSSASSSSAPTAQMKSASTMLGVPKMSLLDPKVEPYSASKR